MCCLPAAGTFWRYVDSLGINQTRSILNTTSALRERLWQQPNLEYRKIHVNVDTTVESLYGDQQGGRKGITPRTMAKKASRTTPPQIARLKLLLIATKSVFHSKRERVKFSVHDTREYQGCRDFSNS